MRALRWVLGVTSVALLTGGCATIVAKSSERVQINTNPTGALVSIKDEDGREVWRGPAPAEPLLKLGNGYFDGQTFEVTASLAGYQDAKAVLDTHVCLWYALGNLGFGGLLGYLIVDPLTGAMWDLPDSLPTIELAPAP